MEADIITKNRMLAILEEVGFDDNKVYEIDDILSEMESKEGIPKLGYTLDTMKCEVCGYVRGSVHPIGMRFPCECYNCGQMSCFIINGE